jgi:hypothetical protein
VLVIQGRALLPHSCGTLATAITDAVREGVRILSAYTLKRGAKVWGITESERSVTPILLPDDYGVV